MSSSSLRPRAGAAFAAGLLCILLAAAAPAPAHAFWGLLGKAAKAGSAAAKTAKVAGTAGKTAAAAGAAEGTASAAARGGAHVADDAAQLGAHAAGPSAFSSVNAALPPEVAAYLAKPIPSLSAADTAHMMGEYRKVAAQASRSGDFTVVEKLPTSANTARTLEPPASGAVPTRAATAAAVENASSSSALPWHAVRLLTHAAQAGNREAQKELARLCKGQEPPRISPEQRSQSEFRRASIRSRAAEATAAAPQTTGTLPKP